MTKKSYVTTLGYRVDKSSVPEFFFQDNLPIKQDAISQAKVLESNFPVFCRISEIISDGEDIIDSRLVYDGSDE